MTVRQRRVVHVQQADARVGHGRPKLVAYGYAWVAEQAGCTTNAVRLAVARGQLELEDPRSVVAWLDARAAQNAKPGGPGSAGRSVMEETDQRGPKGPTSRRGDTVPS